MPTCSAICNAQGTRLVRYSDLYNNGRRAILAIEKGNPGERAFEEVFKAWGQ